MSTTPRVDAIWCECGSLPASEFTTRITELAMEMENELAARGNTLADFEASMVEYLDSEAILEIPTPETDVLYNPENGWTGVVPIDHARDLGRRLTIAREALEFVSKNCQPYGPFWYGGEIQTKVRESLTLTAPKP